MLTFHDESTLFPAQSLHSETPPPLGGSKLPMLEARWPWVVTRPAPGGARGMVYNVHALILEPA